MYCVFPGNFKKCHPLNSMLSVANTQKGFHDQRVSCVVNGLMLNLGIDQHLESIAEVLPILRVLEWGFQFGVG